MSWTGVLLFIVIIVTALQVLLFTATMPEGLQEAAAKWQRKPVSIHLAPGEMSISQTITQVHSHIQQCESIDSNTSVRPGLRSMHFQL